MEKVQIVIDGKLALVDSDQVKKHVNKQIFVDCAIQLQKQLESEQDPICKSQLFDSLKEITGKIVRLNRTIRQNVQFVRA